MSWINGDEGELDALATYLPGGSRSRSSCASIFTAGMTFVAAPAFTYTCATVTFTPLGLWVRKIANMSYEMSRGESGLTEAL